MVCINTDSIINGAHLRRCTLNAGIFLYKKGAFKRITGVPLSVLYIETMPTKHSVAIKIAIFYILTFGGPKWFEL